MTMSQQQQSQTERQLPYTISEQGNTGDIQFTNVLDVETHNDKPSRTIDDNENKFNLVPGALAVILGSTYCFVTLCIILIVPIIELAIGAAYRNQCPINPNIPVYLIVTGACGIATIVLTLAIVGAFICCIAQKSSTGSIVVGCGIGLIMLIIFLMSFFLFIWFIVGNVWIFGAKNSVVYNDVLSPNYCHQTLYQFAFAILIVTYIMIGISCCSSCIRTCFQATKAIKS